MQKDRRLKDRRDYVTPVDRPVKFVQLAGVLERVGNERHQAEDVEVRRARRGPAPQQYVNSDAEINQRDQPEPIVERTLSRDENDFRIQRNRVPNKRVAGLRPDACMEQLPFQASDVLDLRSR